MDHTPTSDGASRHHLHASVGSATVTLVEDPPTEAPFDERPGQFIGRRVVEHGGFSQVRRATQTPFDLVLEDRP
jgi:hypothetical protein